MIMTITVSADVAGNARSAAAGQARAQGWTHVSVFSVRQVGDRLYDVQLDVSR